MTRHLTLYQSSRAQSQPLLIRSISGVEALSTLFAYEVVLYSTSENVDFAEVLGHDMSVGLQLPDETERYIHGYVSNFASVGVDGSHFLYRAELRPTMWLLGHSVNSRIFQDETVPDIVRKVLGEHGISGYEEHLGKSNRGPYLPWKYCVQYRESDLAFVSRLLEYEGIHYWFEHTKTAHQLVFADHNVGHEPKGGSTPVVEYTRAHNMRNRRVACIWDWREQRAVLPDHHTVKDYDHKRPRADLSGRSGSGVDRSHPKAQNKELEVFDHTESVVLQKGASANTSEDYARIRTEEVHVRYAIVEAHTDARQLCAGDIFQLDKGPDRTKGQTYLILSTSLSAQNDAHSSGGADDNAAYSCKFEALDMKHPYRPARVTPKPVIAGLQSAVVAGKGDHWTDQYGRIRVKFHWDRQSKGDELSSCWVRVARQSAGNMWGTMFVPHIGHEVLVSFLDGDPDRPIVVGSVYNGTNKAPADLPDNAYKSIIRDFYGNEIVMDATPGTEHMTLYSPSHASRLTLGKSVRTFTRSRNISCTYDSESYSFGTKLSFNKGNTVSVDRGTFVSAKLGFGASVTMGADIKLTASSSAELKIGYALTYMMSSSIVHGFGREFKKVTGSYRRMSGDDTVIDSAKDAVVTGGENDNTMLKSNDKEIAISFDDTHRDRASWDKHLDGQAKSNAKVLAGLAGAATAGSALAYQYAVDRKGEHFDQNAQAHKIDADTDNISSLGMQDSGVLLAAGMSAFAIVKSAKAGKDLDTPVHDDPSAKVVVSKEMVKLFAGKKQEFSLELSMKQGILMNAKEKVVIKAEATTVESKSDIKMKAADVKVDANIKHPSLTVQK